jgi:hypothetical protein
MLDLPPGIVEPRDIEIALYLPSACEDVCDKVMKAYAGGNHSLYWQFVSTKQQINISALVIDDIM